MSRRQSVVVEQHPEIEVGVETEAKEAGAKVRVERLDSQETKKPIVSEISSYDETKVTIEKGGQVIAQETYGASGQLNKLHGKIGRNDPCWCGSSRKYKKCHYPN